MPPETRITKKALEMKLQEVPPNPSPKAHLEQYNTPANIAAELLFTAAMLGDISGKRVYDLGCGTGIFALGAALLGAEEVTGFDLDEDAIMVGSTMAKAWELDVEFKAREVGAVRKRCDTVLQNPPFGCQNRHSDRAFLEKAMELGKVVYSMHMSRTADFVKLYAGSLGGKISHRWEFDFPVPHTFGFHTKEKEVFDVVAFRIERE